MRSRSGSMNRSVESDQEHNQQSTDHSVVTRRGAPARHSRRERSEYENRSWNRASDRRTKGTTGSKSRSVSRH
ncbi:uncharacterized protein N7487_006520 [Penicillium crustosum]|uniref:uncharacterized protein n=1 Tax=Penicillium crustosum TaxID=36656 RepID=UPI0023873F5E|nr:uncharacterized protein N7487_006520 [Penicillium crustosum]KAJ5412161.1 hypothetical protein N7487_006520 [Penicillium crustosum]